MMFHKKTIQIFILCMTFYMSFISADTQRMRPERVSTVEYINFLSNTIVFEGQKYRLTKETQWYGLKPGEDPRKRLDLKNRRMGYTVAFPKEGGAVITQIWIN